VKIKRGNDRFVIIVGNIVFKFPYFFRGPQRFLRGFIANITEYGCYSFTKAQFLVPVFSLGVVSIQRFEGGQIPTHEEMEIVFEQLPERLRRMMLHINPHNLQCQNWRKNDYGYRLFDYGDTFGYGNSFHLSEFLIPNNKELSKVFCKK